MSGQGAGILQAISDARLPIAIITDLPEARRKKALRALPFLPDTVIRPKSNDKQYESLSLHAQVSAGLNIPAADILYIRGTDGHDVGEPAAHGLRTCQEKAALQQLRLFDTRLRNNILKNRTTDQEELANTVLLPLDLRIFNIDGVDEPERFGRRCNLVFDTVLIIEGLVGFSPFDIKTVEKNFGGQFAVIFGIADFEEVPDAVKIAQEYLLRIKQGGGKRVILVHTQDPSLVDTHDMASVAEGLGFSVERRTWETLLPATGDPSGKRP